MSSHLLYPPIVDSYMPAFVVNGNQGTCRIYFSLSKFNGANDIGTVHISIIKQQTGENAVNINNKDSSSGKIKRLYNTGIILNAVPIQPDKKKLIYYVEINRKEILGNQWETGKIYKVQLRLTESGVSCSETQPTKITEWLNQKAGSFSEWSTVCAIKPISKINYEIPYLGINSDENNNNSNKKNVTTHVLTFSTLELAGSFQREPSEQEPINSYRFILYDNEIQEHVLEDTGDIYLNQGETNNNSFFYTFKTEFEDGKIYKLAFKFCTINNYEDGFYKSDTYDNRYIFQCDYTLIKQPPCFLLTIENDIYGALTDKTSRDMEEDEGRIAIKFFTTDDKPYSGNLCIRRSDSRTNFTIWNDVYITTIKNNYINNAPIFYDYAIESGVYYLYGVQEIDQDGFRSKLEVMNKRNPVMRNFNYSFLLGKNNQQLKLMFDNTMTNFKYQISDTKIDTIGSKYGNVSRNAVTYYKTFPINGLISFWMDENKLFCDKKVIYKYENIVDLYDDYEKRNNITQYNYIYERDFREKVLEFLQDGEFKLFKSPTEGNVIVRLMDVNCTPNQSLDRMLYSFTSNAFEMADNTIENYLKYGFYSLAEPATEFVTYETRLGQLQEDFKLDEDKTKTEEIIEKIYKKYNTPESAKKIGTLATTVNSVSNLKITFDGHPFQVKTNAAYNSANGEKEYQTTMIGNNINYNGKTITVYNPGRIYEFDENIIFNENDKIYFEGPYDKTIDVNQVSATVDFLYKIKLEIYQGKRKKNRTVEKVIGQLFKSYQANENLYNDIYLKHYLNSNTHYRQVSDIIYIELEANPGTVFGIEDPRDLTIEQHVIGITGILRLYDITSIQNLVYIGVQDPTTGEIQEVSSDITINYGCILEKGEYMKE